MTFTRRAVVQGLGIGMSLPLMPRARGQAADLTTRVIPKSEEALPLVGLGTWITFNVGDDPVLMDECAAVIAAFFEGGGRMIDSSPMYGSSQPTIGYGLRKLGHPKRLFSAEKVWLSDPGDGAAARHPALDEHLVLQRGPHRAAAGGDLRERVAGELGVDHRRPRRARDRQPLEDPDTAERGELQERQQRKPEQVDPVQVPPRAEDVEEARRDEVEGDAGDEQPERRSADARPARRRFGLAAGDLGPGIGAGVDRPLPAAPPRERPICTSSGWRCRAPRPPDRSRR